MSEREWPERLAREWEMRKATEVLMAGLRIEASTLANDAISDAGAWTQEQALRCMLADALNWKEKEIDRAVAEVYGDAPADDAVTGPCPRCGAEVVTYPEETGLLPDEFVDGRRATHSWLVCQLRSEMRAVTVAAPTTPRPALAAIADALPIDPADEAIVDRLCAKATAKLGVRPMVATPTAQMCGFCRAGEHDRCGAWGCDCKCPATTPASAAPATLRPAEEIALETVGCPGPCLSGLFCTLRDDAGHAEITLDIQQDYDALLAILTRLIERSRAEGAAAERARVEELEKAVEKARLTLWRLDARGGLGLDVHREIETTIAALDEVKR